MASSRALAVCIRVALKCCDQGMIRCRQTVMALYSVSVVGAVGKSAMQLGGDGSLAMAKYVSLVVTAVCLSTTCSSLQVECAVAASDTVLKRSVMLVSDCTGALQLAILSRTRSTSHWSSTCVVSVALKMTSSSDRMSWRTALEALSMRVLPLAASAAN